MALCHWLSPITSKEISQEVTIIQPLSSPELTISKERAAGMCSFKMFTSRARYNRD